MLKSVITPKFKKGDIVVADTKLICSDDVYLQSTPIIDELFVLNMKNPVGIDEDLLKSWELDTTKKYKVVGMLFNPSRIHTGGYDHMDYYMYLIADIETGFTVHLVEEYALNLAKEDK